MSLKHFNKTQVLFGFFKSKENIIFFIGMFFIFICSFVSVYAANYLYNSAEVSYDNNISGITSDNVQGAIDELYQDANDYSQIREMIYPVGSIYISVEDDTVAKVQERFGGTWEKIEGRFLLSASSSYAAGSTGGSADAVVVSHTHTFTGQAATTSSTSKTLTGSLNMADNVALNNQSDVLNDPKGIITTYSNTHNQVVLTGSYSVVSYNHRRSFSIDATHTHNLTAKGKNSTEGVSGTGKNMPPYLSVYMYKRVS